VLEYTFHSANLHEFEQHGDFDDLEDAQRVAKCENECNDANIYVVYDNIKQCIVNTYLPKLPLFYLESLENECEIQKQNIRVMREVAETWRKMQ